MLNFLMIFLITIGFAILIFGAYMLLSRYVFYKIRVNKWVLLAISIIIFIISFIVPGTGTTIDVVKMGLSGIAAIIFFWFFDVNKDGNPRFRKKKKDIVIKAKAKPNRVKNKNDIKIDDK
ncbi:MAG: hypothetical protein ACRC57_03415 [Sarcina sp.]